MTTRAMSWAAVSSKPQAEGESLDDQHRLNHALAEALDWQIVADITVPGESRSYHRLSDARANIRAYQELAQLADARAFDWLICKDRSRLGRTRRLNQEVAGFLQDRGIRTYSRSFPPSSTDERTESDVWSEAIESGLSEAEIFKLRQRHEMGMPARVRKGKLPSRPPWGYAYLSRDGREPRAEFVDPLARESIRFVVQSYLAGRTKTWIIAEATRRDLPTCQGRGWRKSAVNYILTQPAYFGLVAYGRQRWIREEGQRRRVTIPWEQCVVAEARFEAPFTPRTWAEVRAEERRRVGDHPRRRGAAFPLSGLLFCLEHQRLFVGGASGPRRYYRCRPAGPIHSCREEELHRELASYLRELTSQERLFDRLWQQWGEEPEDTRAEEERLEEVLASLQRRQERLWEAYESGVIELPSYARRARELERQVQRAEARLAELAAARQRMATREQVREELVRILEELPERLLRPLGPEERQTLRATLARAFERIEIQDGRIVGVRLKVL